MYLYNWKRCSRCGKHEGGYVVVSSTMQSTAHLISILMYSVDLNFNLLMICACHDLFSSWAYSLDHGDGWRVIRCWLNLRFFVSGLSQLICGLPFVYFFLLKVFFIDSQCQVKQIQAWQAHTDVFITRMYTTNNHVCTQRMTKKRRPFKVPLKWTQACKHNNQHQPRSMTAYRLWVKCFKTLPKLERRAGAAVAISPHLV